MSGSSSEPALSATAAIETIASMDIVLEDNGRAVWPFAETAAYAGPCEPGGTMYSVIAKMT